MGGTGSGGWCRWNKQTTTEEVKRIDIRYMKKQGLLQPNTAGSLSWKCGDEPSGDIRYSCYQHELQLHYRYREYGGDWQSVEQRIPFDRTHCHYGGERLWFLCPRCNKRVGLLYGADVLFLCRHCYKLPYTSQNQGYTDRVIGQKHKLGRQIFEHYDNGYGWGKKKGMHWKTFDRLNAKYQHLEQQWCNVMARYLHLP